MKTANELATIATNAVSINTKQDKEDMHNFIESLSEKFEEAANAGVFFYFIRFSDLPRMRIKNAMILLGEQLNNYGFEVKKVDDRIKISWAAL